MSATGLAPWKAATPAGYVHMNLGNIRAELDDLERELAVSGCKDRLLRMKELVWQKPYYMSRETGEVLEDQHAAEDMVVVATSHADCYVLQRLPDRRGESQEVVSGRLAAWASEIPLFRETYWELSEGSGPGCVPDFEPFKRYSFDRRRLGTWLAGLPYRRPYTRDLPARWVTVASYRGLDVDPHFYESFINRHDFERNIKPLYPRNTGWRTEPGGRLTGIESVAEAFAVADELRRRMHAADVLCEPTVHVPGVTDCDGKEPSVRAQRWPGEVDTAGCRPRAGEVFAEAYRVRYMSQRIESLRQSLSDPCIEGKRRECLNSELEECRELRAVAERDFSSLGRERIIEALIAADSEQLEAKSCGSTVLSAFYGSAPEEYMRLAGRGRYEAALKDAKSFANEC